MEAFLQDLEGFLEEAQKRYQARRVELDRYLKKEMAQTSRGYLYLYGGDVPLRYRYRAESSKLMAGWWEEGGFVHAAWEFSRVEAKAVRYGGYGKTVLAPIFPYTPEVASGVFLPLLMALEPFRRFRERREARVARVLEGRGIYGEKAMGILGYIPFLGGRGALVWTASGEVRLVLRSRSLPIGFLRDYFKLRDYFEAKKLRDHFKAKREPIGEAQNLLQDPFLWRWIAEALGLSRTEETLLRQGDLPIVLLERDWGGKG